MLGPGGLRVQCQTEDAVLGLIKSRVKDVVLTLADVKEMAF